MNHWEHEHLLNPSCRPGTGDSRGQPLSLRSQERVRETFSVKGQAIVWPVWSIWAGDCHPTLPLGNKSNHRQHANKTLFTKQAVGPVAPSWSVRTSGLERMWTMKHNWRHCGRCYEKALGGGLGTEHSRGHMALSMPLSVLCCWLWSPADLLEKEKEK